MIFPLLSLPFQPQFSSTPSNDVIGSTSSAPLLQHRASSLPTQRHRHVLGSLGSQENIGRQQHVLYKGVVKKTVPSPLSEHAHVAKGASPSGEKGSGKRGIWSEVWGVCPYSRYMGPRTNPRMFNLQCLCK